MCKGQKNVAKAIGLEPNIPFVHTQALHLKGHVCTTYPVLLAFEDSTACEGEQKVKDISATFLGSDIRAWTGISLKENNMYELSADPVGMCTFTVGEKRNEPHIANYRITAGNDLLAGQHDGFAASGMQYKALSKKFFPIKSSFDVTKPCQIESKNNEVRIYQNQKCILTILKAKNPLIAFKGCKITVRLIANPQLPLSDPIQPCLRLSSLKVNQDN